MQLAQTAVDADDIGVQLVVRPRLAISPADDFLDAQEIIVPLAVADFVAATKKARRDFSLRSE